jgi:hypothetical protein
MATIKKLLILICILSSGATSHLAVTLALNQPNVDYGGKYINRSNPNEVLMLYPNGRVGLEEGGRHFSGKYSIKKDIITLSLKEGHHRATGLFPIKTNFRVRDLNTIEKDGNIWLKESEYERLAKLNVEFARLSLDLTRLRSTYSDVAVGLQQRVVAGHALRETLQKLAENRSSVLAPGADDRIVAGYKEELASLDHDLPALVAAAKAERLAQINTRLSYNREKCVKLKLQLGIRPAATLVEWQKKSADDGEYRRLLDERKNLILQLNAEGESTSDIVNALATETKDADAITEYLNSDHKRLQILKLNTDYKAMEKHKIKLLDDYTRAFGSPRERGLLQAALMHLESMVRNRDEASSLGHEPATKQISGLQSEIARLKKRR